MRGRALLVVFSCLLLATPLLAQKQTNETSPKNDARAIPAEDGGTSAVMESIVVSARAQAPFTLTLETEWVRTLGDGGTITLVNQRRIARDAAGRVYQERWVLVPKNGAAKSFMNVVQIADPNTHTIYNCFFAGAKKNVCELLPYTPRRPAVDTAEKDLSGELQDKQGSYSHQFLGKQFVSGVETVGVRETTTYNAGVFGNDRVMTVEREEWYSPQLDLNLLSVRSAPETGKQTFTATNVTLGDPDPELFELPAGFTVADRRLPKTTETNEPH